MYAGDLSKMVYGSLFEILLSAALMMGSLETGAYVSLSSYSLLSLKSLITNLAL